MIGWKFSLMVAAAVPILVAAWKNRRTSLIHALAWAFGAWLAWLASAGIGSPATRYLAVAMTGCAGVAVLGARRPGAAAWHAVVVGLLAVLLMPLAQGILLSVDLPIDALRIGFLAIALLVGLLNYVPTRLGFGALALLPACGMVLRRLGGDMPVSERAIVLILVGAAPWLAWAGIAFRRRPPTDVDALWRDFRDRFGVVWGQRLLEQFNRAAENAELKIELGWRGLRQRDGAAVEPRERGASDEILKALMTRFGPAHGPARPTPGPPID